jgi:hypothetical protein
MIKTIDSIYNKIKSDLSKNKDFNPKQFYLASGGIYDSKGPKDLSDVDIVYMNEKYDELEHIFNTRIFRKEIQKDKKRCFYSAKLYGREVNILATNDPDKLRSIKHRETELMLNKYKFISAVAIGLKSNGVKTEPAYVQALGITDPNINAYDFMLDKKAVKKIADKREKELSGIYKKLPV